MYSASSTNDLGQITMTEIDSALVINLLARDVVAADHVEQRSPRPADRARDIVARLDLGHLVAHLDHLPEALVPDHEVLAPRRSISVEGLVDLAVGGVNADLKHFHQHPPALGDPADVRVRLVGQLRDRDVSQVNTIRLTRQNGNGFHRESRLINGDNSSGQAWRPDLAMLQSGSKA